MALQAVASRVANHGNLLRIAARVAHRFIVGTDKSLALAIRDALFAKLQTLVPGEFSDLYDTNPDGKGWRVGYVSFGLQPASWQAEGIIGGILIKCSYDPSEFRSEKKDDSEADFQHSKGGAALTVKIDACYYNKKREGGCDPQGISVPLGEATLGISATEAVEEVELDTGTVSGGIKKIIKEISANPPDYAQSERRKKTFTAPTGSPKALLNWLSQQQRSDVEQEELEALARAMSERGKPYGMALEEVKDFFRKRHWPIKPSLKAA